MKVPFLFTFLFLISVISVDAQLGININEPHSSTVLHLVAPGNNQGLLIPVVNNLFTRGPIVRPTHPDGQEPANGLMVYYTKENTFYYYHNGWHEINPFDQNEGSNDITTKNGDNIVVTQGNISVNNGDINASNGTVTANTFVGYGTIPVGGIIMWSGSAASIPVGWALCNGANGTPNLRGRFIVGYDDRTSGYPGYSGAEYHTMENRGGEKEVTLTANQSGLRAHNHGITDPGHNHSYVNWPNQAGFNRGNKNAEVTRNDKQTSQTSGSTPTGITINDQGPLNALDAHENRPPYYVLAFIMRIK